MEASIMSLERDSHWTRLGWTSLGALVLLAAVGCTTSIKPPPLPPSPSPRTSASDGGVVPATYVLPDGTKVSSGPCGAG
ncbi:MAG: hypothetical protein WD875_02115 [Pirellulales bacterium]